jgi:superfamily II DNA or RNA helicase
LSSDHTGWLNNTAAALELAISPSGQFYLESLAGDLDFPAPAVIARIADAFERGSSHGLLHLGAVELGIALPSSLAFGRELAHLFMTRWCAVADLEGQWDTAEIAFDAADMKRLAAGIPPMTGAEYLDDERLATLWKDLQAAARAEIAVAGGSVAVWLSHKHPGWNLLGRVCFHLVENTADEQAPFAFLATYAARVSQQSRVQHLALGRALQEYVSNRNALLELLLPVSKASEQSPWLKALVDSGAIYHPLAWSPAQAHQFLQNIPIFEASGIVVRIPDWWKSRQHSRPQVHVRIGQAARGIGLDAMLDFDASLTLNGEALSRHDLELLRTSADGLVRLKGRWIEIDRARLDAVLAHWETAQRSAVGEGISFIEGMRLLARAAIDEGNQSALVANEADWSSVVAGDWFKEVLEYRQESLDDIHPVAGLNAVLRPYQLDGVRWLWHLNRLGLGGCLADDMGLGKTVQVLALLLLARQHADPGPHLLVVPASLIDNWQSEIVRFAPGLRVLVAHSSAHADKMPAAYSGEALEVFDVVITSYGMLTRLPWLQEIRWSLVVLDEAQAIKNPAARQTRAVKSLNSRVRLALTGTPVENRLGDLWSLFDFICPGLLGSDKVFTRFVRQLQQDEHVGYAPLRNLVQPYILRRLKSDKRIIADLPDKTEVKAYCSLSRKQAGLYQEAIDALAVQIQDLNGIARRGAVLSFLMRFKQICNHPSQWLGDGVYGAEESGKFARLREITEAIASRQEKMLVFTQFQEMTGPLADFLQTVFGRPGLILHGATPVKERKNLVAMFQQEQGPPFFVLSIKAGGTGLNLTAASHVIHFDRWWNPAVENQATDRAYRIGQKKNVLVHKFICRGTVEEKIDTLIEGKLGLSSDILEGGAALLTEMSNDELLRVVSLDLARAMSDA